ncbi:hypothetical protein V6N13_000996 [Hibiscus sabdariffa]
MRNCCVVLRALVNRDQTRMGFRGNGSSPFSAVAASLVQQIVTIIMLTSAFFPHCLESGYKTGDGSDVPQLSVHDNNNGIDFLNGR